MKKICLTIYCCLLLFVHAGAQKPEDSKNVDSLDLRTSRAIVDLLIRGGAQKALQLFKPVRPNSRKEINRQLVRISKELQPFKNKTRWLVQVSYRNYQERFNINRVVFYNDEGQYYVFELFYRIEDRNAAAVDLFIKDPAALAKKRLQIAEFRKKNPNLPQQPQSLPPGVYIKEHD